MKKGHLIATLISAAGLVALVVFLLLPPGPKSWCDKVDTAYRRCAEEVPEARHPTDALNEAIMVAELERWRNSAAAVKMAELVKWRPDSDAAEEACMVALVSLRETMGPYCPNMRRGDAPKARRDDAPKVRRDHALKVSRDDAPPLPGQWCDRFSRNYKLCVDALPETVRDFMMDYLKEMQDAWAKMPKDDQDAACRRESEHYKRVSAACPDVAW